MLLLFPKIISYKLQRKFDFPINLPLNLTLSLTNKCNSRCLTCRIYEKNTEELTLEEYGKIFKNLGKTPYWVTISGGEPFLRKDILQICQELYQYCQPKILTIATNALLSEVILDNVEKILQSLSKTTVIVNLSLDGVGEKQDYIRGTKNNYEKFQETYENLRKLGYKNFILGIGTVISKYNFLDIKEILEKIQELKPDSYVTEIAEERVELNTVGLPITPDFLEYSQAIDYVIKEIKKLKIKGFSKFTLSFRLVYYELVRKILKEKKEIIPCYAGISSAQISSAGEVWACCIKAESMGNLRKENYDFRKIWKSKDAQRIREKIKKEKCFCPLANAAYTNMLCDIRTIGKVLNKLFLD